MARISKKRQVQLSTARARRQKDTDKQAAQAKVAAIETRREKARLHMSAKRAEKKIKQALWREQHPEEVEAEAVRQKLVQAEADARGMEEDLKKSLKLWPRIASRCGRRLRVKERLIKNGG